MKVTRPPTGRLARPPWMAGVPKTQEQFSAKGDSGLNEGTDAL
ncbi:MAG: hypothetical protein OEW68_11375 [Gammaproteobacteria bacterium]|nr:hypothetical protein [Gammaproteobacteria bacterium]MDH4315433.1 hypothetical protein [Gammaproteobacteria bacterium]MDH5212679.1 hypothetical protein [Gammaproteobacteria bacterium]MDH5500943.1 hypothetical protein [Gammaproteobacteria bacterium]